MASEREEEKRFAEDIDHLLAGQDTGSGAEVGEDSATALLFARKMKDMREEAPPVFKAQLKGRLLAKIAEEEAGKSSAKPSSFWEALNGLVARRAVWLTATATAVVAVLAVAAFWGSGMFLPSVSEPAPEDVPTPAMVPAPKAPPQPAPEPSPPPPAESSDWAGYLKLETTAAGIGNYTPGEEVSIQFALQNTGPEPVAVTPFPPAIRIDQAATGATVRSFPAGDNTVEIPASGTFDYTRVWNQLDDSDQPVAPGRYLVLIGDIAFYDDMGLREAEAGFRPIMELTIRSP